MHKLNWNLWDDLNEFDLNDSGARPGVWRDRKALYFENKDGFPVLLREEPNFSHYTLQAEIGCPGPAGFIGLVFGARDSRNYELVYISPAYDDQPGEIQYDPIMNGSSTWQIYNGPRYQAPAPFYPGEWTKLTLDVQPDCVAIRVGESGSPQLIISNLQHGPSSGRIGVWGYLPTYIRNLSIEHIEPEPVQMRQDAAADLLGLADETFVTEWIVTQPYLQGEQPEPGSGGIKVRVEENGTLNLNRLFPLENGITVQAACTFTLPEAKESKLTFGFSDQLRLWVNETELYQGDWRWAPPECDGRIRPEHAGVPVIWQAGQNTVRAEITCHEGMFGWGVCVKTGLSGLSFNRE